MIGTRVVCPFVLCAGLFAQENPVAADDWSELARRAAELQRQVRFAEAESLALQAVKSAGRFGPDSVNLAASFYNLASITQDLRKYADARNYYQRSIAIYEKALGPDDLSLAYPLNNLGALCQAQGQYAESEKLRRRSPAIRVGNLGPDHPHVARVLQNLAEIYRLEGRYAEAESLGLAALRAGN